MCSFTIKILDFNDAERVYYFEILDSNFFRLNKKYYTLDSNPVKFYFTKNNKMYFINMSGKSEKHIYKKKFMTLEYNYSFSSQEFKFTIPSESENREANLAINEILYVRSNLVFDCCG